MALQLTTGHGSPLAVGIGAHDIATIYSIGRRLGNWWTASSGDQEFLRLLDEDEMNILTRRGVLDPIHFNATWNGHMTLLSNGEKITIDGEHAHTALGEISRFTASMICIVASLDTFAATSLVRTISRNLLIKLLRTTERGEDLVASEVSNRINAWRSAACIRGIHQKMREIRLALEKAGKILAGTIPPQDVREVVEFLDWLLAGQTKSFHTSSSDLAGIAYCLSQVGFDVLSVEGFVDDPSETGCRLIYDNSGDSKHQGYIAAIQEDLFVNSSRGLCTSVSLARPEEAMSVFPISQAVATRCRYAWKQGRSAANTVQLHLTRKRPDFAAQMPEMPELRYAAVDLGEVCDRIDDEVWKLADAFGFATNNELCQNLEKVLVDESPKVDWLLDRLVPTTTNDQSILKRPIQGTTDEINMFTVFQAFFMGYYYEIFLRLVDTEALQLQIVDGAWGFRSTQLLMDMRMNSSKAARSKDGIPRRTMIELLCSMLCSKRVTIDNIGIRRDCIGYVGKRTLLCNSVLRHCNTPDEIGRFVLLDIDVGILPMDTNGVVRSGVAQMPTPVAIENAKPGQIVLSGPPEDCTRHIEADWDVNPETALLCIRYKGRRLVSLSIAEADIIFCASYTEPIHNLTTPEPLTGLPPAISIGINDLLSGTIPEPLGHPLFAKAFAPPASPTPSQPSTNTGP
ncbi:hypothetical protein GQ44DRAFT_824316 [Phaeosphaeriaceae sp. PMI808]|nr:hypothetical protein GQ44DRAFT_824316 [Phaeosphaeriaceae sp. PMI808]